MNRVNLANTNEVSLVLYIFESNEVKIQPLLLFLLHIICTYSINLSQQIRNIYKRTAVSGLSSNVIVTSIVSAPLKIVMHSKEACF